MKTQREVQIRIVKRGRKHAGHHGGAWKVAFADFMTSMMALFLVLWLITQSSEIRSAIAGYFQDPLGRAKEFGTSVMAGKGQTTIIPNRPSVQIQPTSGKRDKMLQLSKEIEQTIQGSAQLRSLGNHVAIEMTPEGLRISLLEDSNDVFFASGGAHPLPRAEALIEAIGTILGTTGYDITVEGHTDARQYSSNATYDNWELSADRANAARRLLEQGGVVDSQVIAVRGFADRELRYPDHPLDPRNRRVSILVNPGDDAPAPATTPAASASKGSP